MSPGSYIGTAAAVVDAAGVVAAAAVVFSVALDAPSAVPGPVVLTVRGKGSFGELVAILFVFVLFFSPLFLFIYRSLITNFALNIWLRAVRPI